MTIQEQDVQVAVNETKIAANEKRLDKVENIIIWTFSTSIVTLLAVLGSIIKELI